MFIFNKKCNTKIRPYAKLGKTLIEFPRLDLVNFRTATDYSTIS
jgi:hypothetical protein